MTKEPKNTSETHPLFPSGEWEGFYTYAQGPGAEQHKMEFLLDFKRGIVTGSGSDDVGGFSWEGAYDKEQLTCTMNKFYVSHSVFYKGQVDENGIWGIWSMSFGTGGFHIWPKNNEGKQKVKATNIKVKTMEIPLVDKEYLLQKYPGKGGWTYAAIPEIAQNKKAPFGWVQVKGTIDDYELKQYKLMPMGNGKLFLPVKASIRKKIGKEAGDYVHVRLYLDESTLEIPEEILLCFKNEPQKIYKNFLNFTEGERKAYIDWIYSAKKEETQVERIAKMMERLQKGLRLYDQEVK